MRWIALGTVMLATALCFDHSQGGADDDIVFEPKAFVDLPDYGMITVSGTLTGDGTGYKNNTITISCFKDRRECYIASIQQIGHNHMGSIDVDIFPIMKWNADEVVAAGDITELNCSRTTIVIERKSKAAQYVQEPVNQTRPRCLKFPDPKVHKWTIKDPPLWKEMFGKK